LKRDERKWLELLDPAIEMFADLERKRGAVDFTVGGWTMLMRRYRHRKSHDLDLFVQDVSIIRALSPRANELTESLFPDYQEEAAAIKFTLGTADIDVIAAPRLTKPAFRVRKIAGRMLRIEEPREILAKKLLYRGRRLTLRDLFDVGVVAGTDPKQLSGMAAVLGPRGLDNIERRLNEIGSSYERDIAERIETLPAGVPFLGKGAHALRELLQQWRQELEAAG
jgi:hypothetical protein